VGISTDVEGLRNALRPQIQHEHAVIAFDGVNLNQLLARPDVHEDVMRNGIVLGVVNLATKRDGGDALFECEPV
jgi:hypothetical protein